MTNTMEDLRRACAERLRDTIHGREFDVMVEDVQVPHMIGITEVGEVHDEASEDGTLLDPSHNFWTTFHEDISTREEALSKIKSAIYTLRGDGILRITYPYGINAEIIYCEVDRMTENTNSAKICCPNCDEEFAVQLAVDR